MWIHKKLSIFIVFERNLEQIFRIEYGISGLHSIGRHIK